MVDNLIPSQEAREAERGVTFVIWNGCRVRINIKAGWARNDPEKMVLPGVIYATKADETARVHVIAVGWWDWHISLLVGFKHATALRARHAHTDQTGGK